MESHSGKQLLEGSVLASFSEPREAGRRLLPWPLRWRKTLDKSLLSAEGASPWFRAFSRVPKTCPEWQKCMGGEDAAENYRAWGKGWTFAMLTSIMKAHGMIYVFQKWLFGKTWGSTVPGPNWHLSCVIKCHLRETPFHDFTEKQCVFKSSVGVRVKSWKHSQMLAGLRGLSRKPTVWDMHWARAWLKRGVLLRVL